MLGPWLYSWIGRFGAAVATAYWPEEAEMDLLNLDAQVCAFIRPEDGANVGLLHAEGGLLLIDTASSPAEIIHLLMAVDAQPQQVRQVINTHFHSDHTWGNQLFACPILAHCLCLERMRLNLQEEWSEGEFQAYLAELEQTNPQKAMQFRQTLEGLQIKLPDQVFEQQVNSEFSGLKYKVIHMGGHTPDSAIVWLPELGILFASDLIFQGRYPYLYDADIPEWIVALHRLREYPAQAIVPGHGVRCTPADIDYLINYLQETWDRVAEHIRLGHRLEETVADSAFPFFAVGKYEKLHRANIQYMYQQFIAGLAE
jgi:cyclase